MTSLVNGVSIAVPGNFDVYFKLRNKLFLYFFPPRTLLTKTLLPLLTKEILPKNDVEKQCYFFDDIALKFFLLKT